MPFADDETARAYREAWEAWIKQVEHVHRVFLEGESIRPDQLKGLLNREARAKEKYDAARLVNAPEPMPYNVGPDLTVSQPAVHSPTSTSSHHEAGQHDAESHSGSDAAPRNQAH